MKHFWILQKEWVWVCVSVCVRQLWRRLITPGYMTEEPPWCRLGCLTRMMVPGTDEGVLQAVGWMTKICYHGKGLTPRRPHAQRWNNTPNDPDINLNGVLFGCCWGCIGLLWIQPGGDILTYVLSNKKWQIEQKCSTQFDVVKTFTYENREKTRKLKCGDEDERRRTEDVRVITCLCVEMYNLCGSLRNEWGQLIESVMETGDVKGCTRSYCPCVCVEIWLGDLITFTDREVRGHCTYDSER